MRQLKWIGLVSFVVFLSFNTAAAENETPDWLKRVDFGIQAGTDIKPTFYFQTVQPLYQSNDKTRTLFIQPRANATGNTEIYNLGLGYRWLNADESRLFGVNTFYDHSAQHAHYRLGAGLEFLGKILESRLNTYWGLSDKRVVSESSTSSTYEEVVDGLDFEIGGPFIPHLPWIKLYGSGFWYNHKRSKDREGWKLRTRFEPTKTSSFDFIVWDDNKGDTEIQIDGRVTIAFDSWKDIIESFNWNDKPYPDRDLKEEMLEPVERDYNIKVEKWVEGASATIEVRRGN